MQYRTIRTAPHNPDSPEAGSADAILDNEETRVLGSLVEKAATTPDYYPMTLNSLISACNQKSSRDPVVEYDERVVMSTLERLQEKGLSHRITSSSSGSGRVPRFRHLFHDVWALSQAEGAVLCVLMLRGPQTPGELRQRTARIHDFESLSEVEEALDQLAQREKRPLVLKLSRQPGARENRFAHLLSGEVPDLAEASTPPITPEATGDRSDLRQRVDELEQRVAELEGQFDKFRSYLE